MFVWYLHSLQPLNLVWGTDCPNTYEYRSGVDSDSVDFDLSRQLGMLMLDNSDTAHVLKREDSNN